MIDLADIIARLKREPGASGLQALMVFADGSARAVYANGVKSFASAEELAEYAAEDMGDYHI